MPKANFEIEKSFPGSIEETDLDEETANLLKTRNMVKLLQAGVLSSEMSVSEIANFLLNSSPKLNRKRFWQILKSSSTNN